MPIRGCDSGRLSVSARTSQQRAALHAPPTRFRDKPLPFGGIFAAALNLIY